MSYIIEYMYIDGWQELGIATLPEDDLEKVIHRARGFGTLGLKVRIRDTESENILPIEFVGGPIDKAEFGAALLMGDLKSLVHTLTNMRTNVLKNGKP